MSDKKTVKRVKKPAIEVITEEKTPFPCQEKVAAQVTAKTKILFVASEARPFIATGGLADVIGSLPQALAKDDKYDVRVVLPLYSEIKPEWRRKFAFLGNIIPDFIQVGE